MVPPHGLPKDAATNRALTNRQWWTRELACDYMANWPDFDVHEVLGDDPSEEDIKTHDEVR